MGRIARAADGAEVQDGEGVTRGDQCCKSDK